MRVQPIFIYVRVETTRQFCSIEFYSLTSICAGVLCSMSFCFSIVASRLKLSNRHSIRHDVCSVDVKPEKLTLHDRVPPTQWSPLLAVPRILFVSSLLLVLPFSQPPILCSLCVPLLAPAEPMILATLRFCDAVSPRQSQTTLDLLQARSNCNARQSNTVSAATFFR